MSDNKNDGRGFAGLDSMVSDVSDDVRSVSSKPAQSKQEPPRTPPPSPPPVQSEPVQPQPTPQSSPAPIVSGKQPTGGKTWLIWGGIIFFLMWVFGNSGKSNNNTSYSPSSSYSSSPDPAPAAAPAPAPAIVSSNGEKPPVGNGLSFNREQIRYCLTEKYRITAIESIVNSSRQNEITAYNAMVDDYNSRCSHFRYRRGMLEGVRSEVDARADEIRKAAQSSWVRNTLGLDTPTQGTTPRPEAKPKRSKQAQRGEANSGSSPFIDDRSLQGADAKFETLNRPSDRSRQNRTESTSAPTLPENARIASWGSDWVCNSGYRKEGNTCIKVEIPPHAHLASWGSDWQCDPGYRKQGNQCSRVEIPPNAHLASWGSDWQCDPGFRKQGDHCLRVDIPPNAHLASWGSDWQCDTGFKKQGNQCLKVEIPPKEALNKPPQETVTN